MDNEDEDGGSTNPTEPRVFDSVVSNLWKTYLRERDARYQHELLFICLFHLANERGFKIEVEEGRGAEDEG